MTRFADKDDFCDLGGLEYFVDFGEIGVVGFVAATDDDHDIVIWKSINCYASR